MSGITLLNSTGNAKADAIIGGAIGVLEMVFPGRIRAYYLVGSYADGTFVPASDLDIVPIFKDEMSSDEEAVYWELIHTLDSISPLHLGFGLRNEAQSFTQGGVGIKIGSILLYGEDVRDKIPLWPLDDYLQYMIGSHLDTMLRLRGQTPRLIFPLLYPDPHGEFYGYDQVEFHTEAGDEAGTSLFFGHMMVMASTLVTLKTGEYNASKSLSHLFYRAHVRDQWTGFLEALYEKCKRTWQYHIPTLVADRFVLRHLCEQGLVFENHFLVEIRSYLLMQLEQGSVWAVDQAAKISF